ncbi:MAG: hypothetical protein ACLFN4_06645 [Candidatus Acetothermia bacterium]
MAYENTISLAEQFVPLLDEKYKVESKTAMLDTPDQLVREARTADTVYLPSIVLDGLADYDRNAGFSDGDVDISWESHKFTQDRGRQFLIDRMDDQETIEVTLASTTGQFQRNHVVPEIDAYRFAEMHDAAETTVDEAVDETDILEKIDTGHEEMDNAEVPEQGRIIYMNPTAWRYLKQSDALERNFDVQVGEDEIERGIMGLDGYPIVKVPQGRFYTEVTIESDGGFDTAGEPINFMIVHEEAVNPIAKHQQPRIFDPETNQQADAWLFDYRVYHDIFVPKNKTDGVYSSYETEA